MKLLRFFYIDEFGLASLHAQLVQGEIAESTISTEHTEADKKSLKLSFFLYLVLLIGRERERQGKPRLAN